MKALQKKVSSMKGMIISLLAALLAAPLTQGYGQELEAIAGYPLIIAHRGASGLRPEHTLAGYALAIEQGADYIEPDLVYTSDGVLIARHDNYLSTTTDIADHPEFADRKKLMLGREDWFTEDFTLAEIKTLRARQAFEGRSAEFDGIFEIPTFQEVIDLVRMKEGELGRSIGLYPETKVPGHYQELGRNFAADLLAILERNNLNRPDADLFIQSFEAAILKELSGMTELPLIQLVNPVLGEDGKLAEGQSNIPLQELATYADGVGAMKMVLVTMEGADSGYISRAHSLGLKVHAWTFRDDAYPEARFASGQEEQEFFMALGVDGLFTDFPATGVASRNALSDTETNQ